LSDNFEDRIIRSCQTTVKKLSDNLSRQAVGMRMVARLKRSWRRWVSRIRRILQMARIY